MPYDLRPKVNSLFRLTFRSSKAGWLLRTLESEEDGGPNFGRRLSGKFLPTSADGAAMSPAGK
eukprot:CAMPEP_0206585816 /NCGR_PEP_ID=MMETSP0325_2-20121206/36644_1 /ASSEMBLY_ACC=CAM_ASM_000347 /TAXON_ID=2866 /ORGANISM="Crypthecodinium cohnii, Strain Seligo" /LENGTH=62 /DNA_ID=CAMNT_0054093439 /DNA_START=70 /DNA_END=258 /DNA_ORIENTATION=-